MNVEGHVLNIASRGIKKLERGLIPPDVQLQDITVLNLNGNNLQRLDNIDAFCSLRELYANHNQIVRMYYVAKLRNLVHLDLSNNHVLSIEGLKELRNLRILNLSSNNIKMMDASHLQTNTRLEHLDLSHNNISFITNISNLTSLKNLFLHKNQITTLRHCELYLPVTLEVLTLNNNCIADLNEISHLVQLYNLRDFCIAGNPCLTMTGSSPGFDYRPFILNWCMSLKTIDGYVVDDLERLKAEWLYSQGKGRKFRIGEHTTLVRYLAETCPMTSKCLESEQERKLRVILNKAQQYQRQLSQEQSSNLLSVEKPTKRSSSASTTHMMSRSFDPSLFYKTRFRNDSDSSSFKEPLSRSVYTESSRTSSERSSIITSQRRPRSIRTLPRSFATQPIPRSNPLPSSTSLLPAPDSITSPITAMNGTPQYSSTPKSVMTARLDNVSPVQHASDAGDVSSEEEDEMLTPTVEQHVPETTNKHKLKDPNEAAICIQKMWRGYCTRVVDKRVSHINQQLQSLRFCQYIKKLSADMEATRIALDKEHQLQVLQMEAINALWKKVASLQQVTPSVETKTGSNSMLQSPTDRINIKTLAATCTNLDSQVQQLQNTMQEILNRVNAVPGSASNASYATVAGTQTEIIAVHTPSEESGRQKFPYQRLSPRPSTLAVHAAEEAKSGCQCSESNKLSLDGITEE